MLGNFLRDVAAAYNVFRSQFECCELDKLKIEEHGAVRLSVDESRLRPLSHALFVTAHIAGDITEISELWIPIFPYGEEGHDVALCCY